MRSAVRSRSTRDSGGRPLVLQPESRLLGLYARLLGPLLGGYLLFDRAFAYLHLPGTPLFVGEMVLAVGVLGVLTATGYLRIPLRDEPVLALLAVYALWGFVRALPGVGTYGVDAIRDSALWYYSLFAFLGCAAIASVPDLALRLVNGLCRLAPLMLCWLPVGLLLLPLSASDGGPTVPWSTVSVLSHKPGNAAIAALLALGCMWLFPEVWSPRSRAVWSIVALLTIALSATQNRGGLLGVTAGAAVCILFLQDRLRLAARAVLVIATGLVLAVLVPVELPFSGVQGRDYSASQLIANVVSLGGADSPGNLGGTVQGREVLWTRIIDKQVRDGHLLDGSGFGQNLAEEVGVYDEGKDSLRSPHNSHLHILARLGLFGLSLWVAVWAAWYWRMATSCRRLTQEGLRVNRQVCVLCMTVTTAILVSSIFDPQLEGPQIAALLWSAFGIGVAETSSRPWFRRSAALAPAARSHGRRGVGGS